MVWMGWRAARPDAAHVARQRPGAAGKAAAHAVGRSRRAHEALAVEVPGLARPAVADAAALEAGSDAAVLVVELAVGFDRRWRIRRLVVGDPEQARVVVGAHAAAEGQQHLPVGQAMDFQRLGAHVVAVVALLLDLVQLQRGKDARGESVVAGARLGGPHGIHDRQRHCCRHGRLGLASAAHQRARRADAALDFVHLQQHGIEARERQRPLALAAVGERGFVALEQLGQHDADLIVFKAGGAALETRQGRLSDLEAQRALGVFFAAGLQLDIDRGAGAGLAGDEHRHRLAFAALGLVARGAAGARVVAGQFPVVVGKGDRILVGCGCRRGGQRRKKDQRERGGDGCRLHGRVLRRKRYCSRNLAMRLMASRRSSS